MICFSQGFLIKTLFNSLRRALLVLVVDKIRAVLPPLLFFSFSISTIASVIVFASSGNWIEVARFTGVGGIGTTEPFTCDYSDWRIRWEIEPRNDGTERTAFLVYVFPYTGSFLRDPWFESIQHYGTEETSGTLYIQDRNGSFDMDVLASLESYTIIIEQNVESIPEFPSWIILPLTMAATLIAVVMRRRKL
jgi:hypothetical protein